MPFSHEIQAHRIRKNMNFTFMHRLGVSKRQEREKERKGEGEDHCIHMRENVRMEIKRRHAHDLFDLLDHTVLHTFSYSFYI